MIPFRNHWFFPRIKRRKKYVRTTRILHLCALRLADPCVLFADRVLRLGADPLHPGGEAGDPALPAQGQKEYAAHEPYAGQDQGDPDPLRQQQAASAGGDGGPVCPGGRESHVRLSVVLPSLPHPYRPVRHHPSAPEPPDGIGGGYHHGHFQCRRQDRLHRGRGQLLGL